MKIKPVLLILAIASVLLFVLSLSRRKDSISIPAEVVSIGQQPDETPDTLKSLHTMANNINPDISRDLLLGKTDPGSDDRFVLIDEKYANRSGMFLHREAFDAFIDMHEAARQQGIELVVISAMRTFNHQKRIWNGKWNGNTLLQGSVLATDIKDPVDRAIEILRYSAMPGTSRHHWGTDIDLNSLHNNYFLSGEGKEIYDWLKANAGKFGFFQPYTRGDRQGGYEEEKWHWSYHPLASQYLEAYSRLIGYDDITGFDGWETAGEIKVIENYVFTINDIE